MDQDGTSTSDSGCSGFGHIPLPGPRILWDYTTSEAWAQRFERYVTNHLPQQVATIGDLLATIHSQTYWDAQRGLMSEVARWCEGIDEFGSLIWIVSSLPKL